MAADELSPRALRLTELIISLNPAHYTVWLYRFKIIAHLDLSIPSEITWLNEVALDNLKNYQIWHHRQLLLDRHVPTIADDAAALKALSRSETEFLLLMLREDTKNYHVWTYRQYLVKRLGMWGPAELGSTQNLIEEDVRNNSAWSHRFFLVFSNPADYDKVEETDRVSLVELSNLAAGQPVKMVLKKKDGRTETITLNHTMSTEQIEWWKAGAALNLIGAKS